MYPTNAMNNHGNNVNIIGSISNGTIAWNAMLSTLSVYLVKN